MKVLNNQEVTNWLDKHEWTFAKSMSYMPHWYIVKGKLSEEDKSIFEQVVMYIRNNGYCEKFGNRTYTYLNHNGYKYWTMGNPLDQTIIINKAEVKENGKNRQAYNKLSNYQ